jgi:hypothetical protein
MKQIWLFLALALVIFCLCFGGGGGLRDVSQVPFDGQPQVRTWGLFGRAASALTIIIP